MIIKSSLGLSFGVVFSVLLFKRRAWPAWVGLGFGAGRAWEESDGMFTSTRQWFLGDCRMALSAALQNFNSFCSSCRCLLYKLSAPRDCSPVLEQWTIWRAALELFPMKPRFPQNCSFQSL